MGNLKSNMTREEWGFYEKIYVIEADIRTGVAQLCIVYTALPSIFFGVLCYSNVSHYLITEELGELMNNKVDNISIRKGNKGIIFEIYLNTQLL